MFSALRVVFVAKNSYNLSETFEWGSNKNFQTHSPIEAVNTYLALLNGE